ncbi:REP-associated tyrosine transposase [Zhongshania aliphaticivorans]|uniref:REP-associated tyrosine transposase n=1 Tax=Zhongshania aliphaticivorans TaxID=1470434 RepID=UPI0012E6139D|nr:transposase [Zhongshania aliphaticivorans]CAA0118150.1 REP-associated tyrosine transposase [Zhongshania aliphaticivorans]
MNNPPKGGDLRLGRRSLSGQAYLITTCTAHRQPYFNNFWIGRGVVTALREVEAATTLAFVVMPDHLHWLMVLHGNSSLSRTVQFLKTRSAHNVNRLNVCDGRVWQRGFHDRALRQDDDVVAAARYIVANPLRAGLVENVGEYPLWDAIYF